MKKLSILVFLSTLFFQSTSFANDRSLDGVWKLKRFEFVEQNGQTTPYCNRYHGFVIYERRGYVTFNINCAGQSDRDVFYGGKFISNGKSVYHRITNSKNVKQIGTTVKRDIRRSGRSIFLNGVYLGKPFITEWIPM